ncbi:MAG TPA: isoaspartyl peptidase/L-asparaginase [Saprospiraceae bacterium]|nr:isoaspartyl peptidase/L-asparaginase [Saprospiraceae bacterium]HRK80212.1 isoaspartyl peptidase/L-asparaginase [Saprospiraceae bacterium]
MKQFAFLSMLAMMLFSGCKQSNETGAAASSSRPEYALVIHGGAGTIRREDMSPEKEAAYTAALNQALDIGEEVLRNGGSAMDAVEAVIVFLEDTPLFNAGKGAVFTNDGRNELDASFMNGATREAGAVAGVTIVKNPIRLARKVMENSVHVMMAGKGAELFAKEQGLDTVPPEYFFTQERWDGLQRAIDRENKSTGALDPAHNDSKFGTVGCVALDKSGNIAAGTSTGGMTNKRYGRVGDAPIIGAGTYADNATCGVSATGHGEFFIRYTVARDIAALMEYKGLSLNEAADMVVNKKLVEAGGEGGVIALDRNGNVAMPFNSAGMYRGYAKPGKREVGIYKE